jgi:hypothetical protein
MVTELTQVNCYEYNMQNQNEWLHFTHTQCLKANSSNEFISQGDS